MSGTSDAVRYFLFSRHRFGYGVHSPFAYRLVKEVLRDHHHYPELKRITAVRKKLNRNRKNVMRKDFGTPGNDGKTFTVGAIARRSAVRPKYGTLLFRLSRYFKPAHILELGTSLGISTLYLALGHPEAEIVTIEGDPGLSRIARDQFKTLSLHRINQVTGNFRDELMKVLSRNIAWDMVFIDGDHHGEALVSYFRQILPFLHPKACIILDDIYYSRDMKEAWKRMVRMPEVTLSVDLWQFGILFVDPGLSQEKYIIRY